MESDTGPGGSPQSFAHTYDAAGNITTITDVRRPRRLVTLSASLALNSGVLLAVLLAVSGETELGALFIDLTESAVPEAVASNAATPTPAAAGRGGARAVRSIAAARPAPTPPAVRGAAEPSPAAEPVSSRDPGAASPDRKSTRLNSSHSQISYAAFCLKKKTPRQPSRRTCRPLRQLRSRPRGRARDPLPSRSDRCEQRRIRGRRAAQPESSGSQSPNPQ